MKLKIANRKSLNPVIQQEPTGCGIACVAMLSNRSYTQTRKIATGLGIFAADLKLWSDTGHVRRLLSHLDMKVAKVETPFKGWNRLPDCALLAVKWHKEKGIPFWHWTVFVRDGERSYVLDPKKGLKNNRRTDFGRIKPKWFLEVTL